VNGNSVGELVEYLDDELEGGVAIGNDYWIKKISSGSASLKSSYRVASLETKIAAVGVTSIDIELWKGETLASAVRMDALGTITGNGKLVWNGNGTGNQTGGGGSTPTTPTSTSYTVTFKDGETTLSTATVEEGEKITKPTDPTKDGFEFVNWYTDSALTTEYDFTSTITGNTTIYAKWQQNLAIGDTFNYSTTINGITLSDWKIFHIDGNKIYIIYEDYLPNAAVSDLLRTTYNLTNGNGTYSIKSTNREDLIDAMKDKDKWSELVTNGKVNGTSTNLSTSSSIWAMGAPELDLWVNSWNASYSSDRLYTNYANPVSGKSYDGWYVGDQENPSTTDINISGKTGYGNTLYFPHQTEVDSCSGYWLASPSAIMSGCVMDVPCGGKVYWAGYNTAGRAFRPVVCLPSNILNQ